MDLIAEARGLINRFIIFSNPYKLLGGELARIALTRIDLVYEVFRQLAETPPAKDGVYPRTTTGYFMLVKLSDCDLIEMAKNDYGLSRLNDIETWLGNKSYAYEKMILLGEILAPSFQNVKNRIAAAKAAATGSVNTCVTNQPNQTSEAQQLSVPILDDYRKKAKKGETFNENVVWELPESGTGFITYNRNDMPKDGLDQIGTKETIDLVLLIAREWSASSLNKDRRILQIGDISRPGGLDTSQHKGHEDGKNVDIRPLRNDALTGKGANLNYNSSTYDRESTKSFIRFVKASYPSIFIRFNDGEIAGKGEFTYVHKDSKGTVHNDHLHLEFR